MKTRIALIAAAVAALGTAATTPVLAQDSSVTFEFETGARTGSAGARRGATQARAACCRTWARRGATHRGISHRLTDAPLGFAGLGGDERRGFHPARWPESQQALGVGVLDQA